MIALDEITLDDVNRVAKAIHRAWARHTRLQGHETPDEAHERRWNALMPKVRAEFIALAEAACKAL